jgi:hypothetical protein
LRRPAGLRWPALRLADPAWQEERGVWLAALAKPSALPAVALAARVETGARDERRDRLALVIDWLAAVDIGLGARGRRRRAEAQSRLHGDPAGACAVGAPTALFRYHRSLAEQRALVTHPLQPRLVAESLLFGYRELFV